MNRRHYQLFAVSMLIGAPLLVSVATNALPSIKGAMATSTDQPAPAAPNPDGPPPDPMAALPAPLAPPASAPEQQNMQAGQPLDAAPSLDPTGIDPSASIGAPAAAPPAPPSQRSAPSPSGDPLTLPDVPPENRE